MQNVMKPRPIIARARSEGYELSEYALRTWLRTGAIPSRKIGRDYLVYYPNVIAFLTCSGGGDVTPPPENPFHGW